MRCSCNVGRPSRCCSDNVPIAPRRAGFSAVGGFKVKATADRCASVEHAERSWDTLRRMRH
jgi:hypothetical protein